MRGNKRDKRERFAFVFVCLSRSLPVPKTRQKGVSCLVSCLRVSLRFHGADRGVFLSAFPSADAELLLLLLRSQAAAAAGNYSINGVYVDSTQGFGAPFLL